MDTVQHLIHLTQGYYSRGWTPATSSNFSIRTQPDVIHITRSGKHKGRLQPQDFMQIKTSGELIDKGKPSAETGLHLLLYQKYQQTNAVLHTHSPKATLLSMVLQQDRISFADYEIAKAFTGVTSHDVPMDLLIFDNSQDIDALAQRIAGHLDSMTMPAFLIRGHGIYTWGNSLEDADRHLEAIEFLLECETMRRQMSL